MFQELSSCLATMEAAKVADCDGFPPGHSVQPADAEQAYMQSKLGGVPTWVRLPRDVWPASWAHIFVILYGHPDSGGYWEQHWERHPVFRLFPTGVHVFGIPALQLYLVVYVDDFKLVGPSSNISQGWSLAQQGLKLGSLEPVGLQKLVRDISALEKSWTMKDVEMTDVEKQTRFKLKKQ